MNYRFILVNVVVMSIFFSCEKDNHNQEKRVTTCVQSGEYEYLEHYKIDSMCTSEVCSEYLEIWKELFKEKNNLSNDFFNSHIQLCESEIHSWADGISFRICYKVQINWAVVYNCDQFIIKIDKDKHYYPALNLPRDTYLSKDEIKIVVENRAFSSHIINISNSDNLKFYSMENALNSLITSSSVNTLCISEIYVDATTGNLMLEAWAEYESEENSCIKGIIDLINGSSKVVDSPCVIGMD